MCVSSSDNTNQCLNLSVLECQYLIPFGVWDHNNNFTIYEQPTPNDATVIFSQKSMETGAVMKQALFCCNACSAFQIHKKKLLLSDTCGGQNRNQHVTVVVLYAVQWTDHIRVIEQFLERGHTYMECEFMHSTIEVAQKNFLVLCICMENHVWSCRCKNPYEV